MDSDSEVGVVKEKHLYHLALHPAQFCQFNKSITNELNRKISKYNQQLEGILLRYDNVKLNSNQGNIGQDSCYIHFDLEGDFYIFKPTVGMVLNGVVKEKSKNHVGCVIYETFNVSLPIGSKHKKEWIGRDVKVGNTVQFELTSIDVRANIIHLRGELLSILAANESEDIVPDLQQTITEITADNIVHEATPKKKKKDKKGSQKEQIDLNQLGEVGEPLVENTKKHKKRSENHDSEEIQKKREKRKEKKIKQESDVDNILNELDIQTLFENTTLDVTQSNSLMANNEDRRKRKRTKSMMPEPFIDPIKLEPDSDLESILGNKRRKLS